MDIYRKKQKKNTPPHAYRARISYFQMPISYRIHQNFCESNDKSLYLQKERTREHTIRTTTLYLQQN